LSSLTAPSREAAKAEAQIVPANMTAAVSTARKNHDLIPFFIIQRPFFNEVFIFFVPN
jgi:hypothetical protein